MEELEQANSAIEIAKKKGGTSYRSGIGRGDANGTAETAPEFSFDERSGHYCEDRRRYESCADARDEIQGMCEWRNASGNPTDAAGYAGDGCSRDGLTASSDGGNEASGRGGGGESKESKNRCWEEPKKKLSDGEPEQRGQQHQGPEVGVTDENCVILIVSHTCLQESVKAVEKPNDKETIEMKCNEVTETLMRAVGTDWSELDETVKTSIAKAVQDRFNGKLKW